MHCAYHVDFNPQTLVSQSKFQDKNKQVWLCVCYEHGEFRDSYCPQRDCKCVRLFRQLKLGNVNPTVGVWLNSHHCIMSCKNNIGSS